MDFTNSHYALSDSEGSEEADDREENGGLLTLELNQGHNSILSAVLDPMESTIAECLL